jgi:glycoside/pentoside/hexuronide:cation symporter, GPH family
MVENNNVSNMKPFGFRDKIGYMLGDFGNDFTFIFASAFLMLFYTKVLGLSGALVGTIFLMSRIVDAFTDIGMGRLVDTLKPAKDGRFRPWIRRMSIPVVIASMLMFLFVVKDWSYTAKVIYAFVTYILWGSVCYTANNIPYGSMAAVLSSEAGDRAALSTFRSIGATLASLVIGVLTPLFIYTADAAGNQVLIPQSFTILAIVYGGLAVICYTLCYKFCTERIRITPAPAPEKGKGANLITALFTNRALLAMIGAALLLLLAMLMSQAMNSYLFMDYFKKGKVLSILSFVNTIAVLLVATFTTKLTKRFGKKEVGSISVLFASIVYFLLYFLKVQNVTVFMALFFIATIGVSIFNVIIWAFITDVIDYQEVKTHKREDGTVYAVYSFARKLGQALAGGIGGFALTAIGYVSEAASQTKDVVNNIYNISTIVPAIAYLGVALILFFAYPLSKKRVEENSAELKRRHEAGKVL